MGTCRVEDILDGFYERPIGELFDGHYGHLRRE